MSHTVLIASETPAVNMSKQKAPKLSEVLIDGSSLRKKDTHTRDRERQGVSDCAGGSCNRRYVACRVHTGTVHSPLVRNTLRLLYPFPRWSALFPRNAFSLALTGNSLEVSAQEGLWRMWLFNTTSFSHPCPEYVQVYRQMRRTCPESLQHLPLLYPPTYSTLDWFCLLAKS